MRAQSYTHVTASCLLCSSGEDICDNWHVVWMCAAIIEALYWSLSAFDIAVLHCIVSCLNQVKLQENGNDLAYKC